MHVFNTLAPVFLIIGLGWLLRRVGFYKPADVTASAGLVYWVGLPCLLFIEVARAEVRLGAHWPALAVLLGATVALAAIGYLLAWALGVRGRSVGAFVQAGFRGNLAFIGLAVLIWSAAAGEAEPSPLAVILLTLLVIFYNVLSVVVLLAGSAGEGAKAGRLAAVGRVLGQVAANPLILASLGGAVWGWAGLPLPVPISRTLEALGQFALPLALLAIGGALRLGELRRGFGGVLGASLIKVGAGPALGWLLGRWAGLGPAEMRIVMVFMACPTAAAAYVMADQLGSDRHLSAGAVALSTMLSLVSLGIVVSLW